MPSSREACVQLLSLPGISSGLPLNICFPKERNTDLLFNLNLMSSQFCGSWPERYLQSPAVLDSSDQCLELPVKIGQLGFLPVKLFLLSEHVQELWISRIHISQANLLYGRGGNSWVSSIYLLILGPGLPRLPWRETGYGKEEISSREIFFKLSFLSAL